MPNGTPIGLLLALTYGTPIILEPIGIIINDPIPGGILVSGADSSMILSGGPNGYILDNASQGDLGDQSTTAIIENRVT